MAGDPYKYFRIEARELLDQLGAGVLELEKDGAAADAVARLLRVAHTLKGAARVVKHRTIADLAHAIEDVLAPVRDAGVAVTRPQIETLLAHADAIGAQLRSIGGSGTVTTAAHEKTVDATPALRADVADLDALVTGIAEAQGHLAHMRRSVSGFERLRVLTRALGDIIASPKTSTGGPSSARVRGLVDELRIVIGATARDLALRGEQTDRELVQAREAAERLRLLPAGLLFHSLERTARDVAVELEKVVAFEGRGGDVRIDADVLSAAGAALVQAVRNAVVHGIEAPTVRASVGKAQAGLVVVEVSRRGNRVLFSCRDDGAGMDLQAVRAAAERRGMASHEAQSLDVQAALRILLAGGLSTSKAVTELSGRAVGLDLVRATARRLGGEVSMRTEAGRGTTLELLVPVSASSLDVLVVEASEQAFALPLAAVRRAMRVNDGDVTRGPDGEAIVFDGALAPCVSLTQIVRAAAGRPRTGAGPVVVVECDGATAAIRVDRIVGTDSIVLRPLPELTPAHVAVLGVSSDAVGAPRIVLDPAGLVSARRAVAPVPPEARVRPKVLVIDDSLTTRMLEQSILESAGYDVDVAVSGEEGLEKARAHPYGLFLVDVEMPGMDGFTFIERTRADAVLRDVPAMLVTSRATPADRERGRAVGAIAHIEKSEFDQNDLLARIRALIG